MDIRFWKRTPLYKSLKPLIKVDLLPQYIWQDSCYSGSSFTFYIPCEGKPYHHRLNYFALHNPLVTYSREYHSPCGKYRIGDNSHVADFGLIESYMIKSVVKRHFNNIATKQRKLIKQRNKDILQQPIECDCE